MLTKHLFFRVRNSYALCTNCYGIVAIFHKTSLNFSNYYRIIIFLCGHELCWSKVVKCLTFNVVHSNIICTSLIFRTNIWNLCRAILNNAMCVLVPGYVYYTIKLSQTWGAPLDEKVMVVSISPIFCITEEN